MMMEHRVIAGSDDHGDGTQGIHGKIWNLLTLVVSPFYTEGLEVTAQTELS